ncbi:MAG: efflux RND transporter permease subunit [Sedimentisphaerales bacterium]|nr:efflux RND transporter permease subunit [Sedimentisphaerales bacterium]
MSKPVEPEQKASSSTPADRDWMTRIVETFLGGNLSVLLILLSLFAGVVSLLVTPREEDPQIIVPMADVMISMPGASAAEVERQVSTRLEKLLYQIPGVEYVYSTSMPGQAIVTVRFYVGQDLERSSVKLHNKIQANIDQVPPGVAGWVVKPIEIDDVPIVSLTLYSPTYSDYELRRMAEELEIRLQGVKNAGRTYVVAGRPREITVHLSPGRMAGYNVALSDIQRSLQGANVSVLGGELVQTDRAVRLQTGRFLTTAEGVENLVVSVNDQRPVFLKQVADVEDGPAEPTTYSRLALGPQAYTPYDPLAEKTVMPAGIARYEDYPAVTVAVAKRKGTNAVTVSEDVKKAARTFAAEALPEDVHVRVTRDYGHTADEKVNELIEALLVAIAIVVALLAYSLGWREGLVIAVAVPITFSVTLLINLLLGYTINRVTLFALILSLGLVVDDPIVDVENIHRHFAMRLLDPYRAIVRAVNEVRPPIILATLAVIISFVPMFFITGMMGPYMAPMALNVPIAMLMSLVVAFTITPWLSYRCLQATSKHAHGKTFVLEESGLYRFYRAVMMPIFARRLLQWGILGAIVLLMLFAGLLVLLQAVPLKMLPFDNKSELQVVIDMPEGTTVETTEAVAHDLAGYLLTVPEVTDVTATVGMSSPIDFNGLVRHYYLRQGGNVADVRLNLVAKKKRSQQSHAIALRVRNDLQAIASRHGASIKIVESPPGPPVISTLVAEVYGSTGQSYAELATGARTVRRLMEETANVVDVDDILVASQVRQRFVVDRTKAALNGISTAQVAGLLGGAAEGARSASLRLDDQVNPVWITLRLPRDQRHHTSQLGQLTVRGIGGEAVPLAELGQFEETTIDQPIYHKNLRRVVYVFGDTAGLPPPVAVFQLGRKVRNEPTLANFAVNWAGEGEWEITLRVFRDLGIAFSVAVLGIYVLLLYQTGSYLLPAIQLVALPLTIIGIMPGFWLLNVLTAKDVSGWHDPVYFTATAMIGIIALSGIATRNAILLVEFVEERKKEGKPLVQSLLEAGALRTRPILLTSLAAMLAAWPITLDPIFSGLAWSLIFGLLVSTLFTLVVVPMIYFMAYGRISPCPAGARSSS